MKTNGKSRKDNISSEEKPSLVLGKIIKEAREKDKLSLDETAFILEVSKEYLRKLENGIIKSPGVDKIIDIFYLFNLDINILNELFLIDSEGTRSRSEKLKNLFHKRQLIKQALKEEILKKKS